MSQPARYGFHLSLVLEAREYRVGESIPVNMRFNNDSDEMIRLDGILPLRSSANPPYLDIEAHDGRLIRIEHGIPRELMTKKPIVIRPHQSVSLIQLDLPDAPAWIRTREESSQGEFGKDVARLAPELLPGDYSISGHFHPTPQAFWSDTEWIPFTIR
jgi:hypothetical protein